jgi:HEAT repeat protein
LVGTGKLWGEETSVLMSRVEHLIGAPVKRADEEAAADAAHALYVLRSLDDEEARRWAIDELGGYCSHNAEIQQAMLLVVKTDQSESNRLAAAEHMSAAALFPADVVPVLIVELGESLGCFWAALAEFCAQKKSKYPGSHILSACVKALARYGSKAEAAVPQLVNALTFPDTDIVREAAHALGEIGAGAAEALPALERIAVDPENVAARECREAAARIRS